MRQSNGTSYADENMTPTQLISFMNRHQMDDYSVARLLGVTVGAVSHWRLERRSIPTTAARVLLFFEFYPEYMDLFKNLTK